MSAGAPSGFSPRGVLGLLAVGAIAFVVLLYALGAGLTGGDDRSGAHGAGHGLTGFAALAGFLERDGLAVRRLRNPGMLDDPGLLVLTPPHHIDTAELDRVVDERRYAGPTLVVTPKWFAAPLPNPTARKGWEQTVGADLPQWEGFRDELSVALTEENGAPVRRWRAGGSSGPLPAPKTVLSGSGSGLIPLVRGEDGRVLAGFLADDGYYPALNAMAGMDDDFGGSDENLYPIVIVFEPDLLDNWGLANQANALLARDLVRAASEDEALPVMFDLTFNGLARSDNLLTLAFRPPFVAATICLLLAAAAVGWRAFNRFGPPWRRGRAIALGKAALVANSAGLVRRTGRAHLVTAPYAASVRDRIAAALGFGRGGEPAEVEAAIDRVQDQRGLLGPRFSAAAAALREARKPHEVARRAAALREIERTMR